jgi:hypothetical protein
MAKGDKDILAGVRVLLLLMMTEMGEGEGEGWRGTDTDGGEGGMEEGIEGAIGSLRVSRRLVPTTTMTTTRGV